MVTMHSGILGYHQHTASTPPTDACRMMEMLTNQYLHPKWLLDSISHPLLTFQIWSDESYGDSPGNRGCSTDDSSTIFTYIPYEPQNCMKSRTAWSHQSPHCSHYLAKSEIEYTSISLEDSTATGTATTQLYSEAPSGMSTLWSLYPFVY